MLIQFYTPFTRLLSASGGLAGCIKRESLSPHASGGEQTSFSYIKSFRSPREMTPSVYLIGASSILAKTTRERSNVMLFRGL